MDVQNATYGAETDLAANAFTRAGYAFEGWSLTASGAVAYADGASVSNLTAVADTTNTLYAVWKANDYSIAFHANGGEGEMEKQDAVYGKALALAPNSFSREGYNFGGWKAADGAEYGDGATVSNLATIAGAAAPLYAVWNPVEYNLSFDADGGTGDTAARTVSYDSPYGGLPSPTRPGYEFVGWFDENGSEVTKDTRVKSTNAVTVKARWTPIAYNVVFDANGGEGWKEPFETICRYGEEFALPTETFVRAGYTLDGWDCGGTKYVCGAIVSNLTTEAGGRVTFAAQWKPVTYSVVFDGNGGTCETNSASSVTNVVAYGEELEVPAFVRLGRILYEWNCADAAYPTNAVVSNLTTTAGGTVKMRANWNLGPNELSEALDIDNLVFENDSGEWTVRDDNTATNDNCIGVTGTAVVNGSILATETDSGGTISFSWKFATKDIPDGSFFINLKDNGNTLWLTNFNFDTAATTGTYGPNYTPHWEQVVIDLPGNGIHSLQWIISGANVSNDDEGILLDHVTWEPAGGAAGIAAVEIPVAVPGLVYDGTAKTGVVEGAGYTLVGNVATNADGYLATATLDNKAASVWADGTTDDREIPWRIASTGIDFSGVAFTNASFTFDGDPKRLDATGMPDGVEVTYDGNDRTEVGEYTVTAWFSSTTGNLLTNMTAKLTIEAPSVDVPSAVAGLVYDGTAKTGVVENVGYTLVENVATAAGDYVATATLEDGYVWSDDGTTEPREISWSIARATYDMDDVLFEDGTFEFDGTNLYLAVEGDLPDGVEVLYLYNGKSKVGTYTIIARFTAADAVNYEPIPDMSATLTIVLPPTRIEVPTAVSGLGYDGSAQIGVVEGVGYALVGNVATDAGSYTATATLEDGYVWADGTTVAQTIQWSIAKATYDMSGVIFEDKKFEADGTEKSLAVVTNTLPADVTVSYDGNGKSAPGTYTVTAKFTGDETNYEPIPDMTATLIIEKKSDPTPPGPGPGPVDPEPEPELPSGLYPSGVAALDAFTAEKAATYGGWLKDKSGKVVALLTVKTKAAKSGKPTKSTITVKPVDGKKYTKKATFYPGGNPVDEFGIVYGARGLLGTFDGYSVEASCDVYKSKVSEVKALAAKIPAGTYTFSVDTGDGEAVFSAVVAKSGKTKVKGYLADGTKFSVSAAGALGEKFFAVPVVSSKAKTRLGCVLWIPLSGGSPTLSDFYDTDWKASLSGGSHALSNGEHVFDFAMPTFREYLSYVDDVDVAPIGAVFTVAGSKWDAGKSSGRIKIVYGELVVTGSSPSNLAALKFKYTAKTGLVKGSFKLYYMAGGKIKYDKVTITGVVVDGRFVGSGTVKKLGSFGVAAE